MANGDFLKDISEGIFGRLSEVRKEQESKDEAKKMDIIKLYSGMADKIRPEGLPILMGELGKVIGVKGKLKGFWDAFSGMPDRSIEDQLGTQLRNFPNLMVGAETAAKTETQGDLARLFQGGTQTPEQKATGQQWMQQEKDLSGKMIFRDPRQEKLEEIKARAEVQEQLQAERAQTQAYYQGLRQEDSQRHQAEMKKLGESLRAKRPLRVEAEQIALLNGRTEPERDDYERAAGNLQVRGQLSDDAMRELIEVRRLSGAKMEAETRAISPTGMKQGEADRLEIARRREVNIIQQRHQGSLSKVAKAKGEEQEILNQINAVLNEFFKGTTFVPGQGLVGPKAGAATVLLTKELEDYRSKKGAREAAEKEAQGSFDQAGRSAYGSYLKKGATHLDPIEIVEPPKHAVPPSKGNVHNVGIGSQRPRRKAERPPPVMGAFDKIMRGVNPAAFKDGQVIDTKDGKKWKVTGKGADHIRLSPVIKQ